MTRSVDFHFYTTIFQLCQAVECDVLVLVHRRTGVCFLCTCVRHAVALKLYVAYYTTAKQSKQKVTEENPVQKF